VVQCRVGPAPLGRRRLQLGLVQRLVTGSADLPSSRIVQQVGEVVLEDLDRAVVHRQVDERGGAGDDPIARDGHRHPHRPPSRIGGFAQPLDEGLTHRRAVPRSPSSLAERADLQQLDAGRGDPLAGPLAGHVGGAQALMPGDQYRGRLGHVIDGHRRRHREFRA
jgi:hypothetical protein